MASCFFYFYKKQKTVIENSDRTGSKMPGLTSSNQAPPNDFDRSPVAQGIINLRTMILMPKCQLQLQDGSVQMRTRSRRRIPLKHPTSSCQVLYFIYVILFYILISFFLLIYIFIFLSLILLY